MSVVNQVGSIPVKKETRGKITFTDTKYCIPIPMNGIMEHKTANPKSK